MKRKLWWMLCLLLLLTACGKKQEATAIPEPTATPPAPIWADATPVPESVELRETELESEETEDPEGDISCIHESLETVITDATCTENGRMCCVCRDCGKVIEDRVLVSTGHNWAITAEENGHYSVCALCGQKAKIEKHTFKSGVCEVCGYGCDHSYENVVTEATCRQAGCTTHTCTICGYSFADKLTPASGHNYVRQTDADGKDVYVCAVCGEQMEEAVSDTGAEKKPINLPEVTFD